MIKEVDVVIISDARTPELANLTNQAIDSCGIGANIIVVESNRSLQYKKGITLINPEIPFNYNSYLNLGAKAGSGRYIFFGNNDLLFSRGWQTNLVRAMENNQVVSASPLCPKVAEKLGIPPRGAELFGYDLIARFCGWAYMWTRSFYNSVGGLDESFTFWCSDNVAVNQLRVSGKTHMLVPKSLVTHLNNGHNTLSILDEVTINDYTIGQVNRFNKKFGGNLWNSPHFTIHMNEETNIDGKNSSHNSRKSTS